MLERIPPCSGMASAIRKGQRLRVLSPEPQQVADLFCIASSNPSEHLSSAYSIDQAETTLLTTGQILYSNHGNPMMEITHDTCGRHDFLLPPCRKNENGHIGCYENLTLALGPYRAHTHDIGTAFNIFMNVRIEKNGRISILPPLSKAQDEIVLTAKMDLMVALTACAHLKTNAGRCKPMHWEVLA